MKDSLIALVASLGILLISQLIGIEEHWGAILFFGILSVIKLDKLT